MAPMSSQMKPNIATRASRRVPLAVVIVGVGVNPSNCARKGAPPVAIAEIDT